MTPGDEEDLFRSFVHGRSQALARSAYLLTGDHAVAEDLLQSALVSTWLHWSRIEDKTLVEGYVRRSMINTLTSWRRRRSYGEVPVAAPPTVRPGTRAAQRTTGSWSLPPSGDCRPVNGPLWCCGTTTT